jgi:hypothetical protein
MSLFGSLSRRAFLQFSSGAAVGSLIPVHTIDLKAEAQEPPASNDLVRFGIIGVGTEGSALLRSAVTLPNVQCVAASDLYDGRHTLAKEIADKMFAPRVATGKSSTIAPSNVSSWLPLISGINRLSSTR